MLSVAVQAGGQSRRMGQDKALKPFLGRPLIERVLTRLAPIADDLLITSSGEEVLAFPGVRQVPDVRPGFGPLGGLYTALQAARFQAVAVAACDMPFASAPLLVASAGILTQDDVDVVIAETSEGLEPLHAVYRRTTCLQAIEAAMDEGLLRMISWFPSVRVRRLTKAELSRYDPDGLAFWNVNTPDEFVQAEAQASGR
jgi:molybdopterin-guanine dinucleotide biosynthesis protein A